MRRKGHIAALMLIAAVLLASCSSSVRFASSGKSRTHSGDAAARLSLPSYEPQNAEGWQAEIVRQAEKWLGVPYSYGGTDTEGIDCSSLTQNVYAGIGVQIPRTSGQQYDNFYDPGLERTEIGDLIFFTRGSGISHVGLYIGGGYIIHASTSQGVVRQSLETDYLKKSIAGTGRVLRN